MHVNPYIDHYSASLEAVIVGFSSGDEVDAESRLQVCFEIVLVFV